MQKKIFKPTSVGVLLSSDEIWDLIEMVDKFSETYKNDEAYVADLKKIRTKLAEAEKFYLWKIKYMSTELLFGLSGLILQLVLIVTPALVAIIALGVNDLVKP